MSKLLSNNGLRAEIASILLLDRQAMEPYVSAVDDLINLVNTQKRLYAESVIGELENEADNPMDMPRELIRNELRAEQRARIK